MDIDMEIKEGNYVEKVKDQDWIEEKEKIKTNVWDEPATSRLP